MSVLEVYNEKAAKFADDLPMKTVTMGRFFRMIVIAQSVSAFSIWQSEAWYVWNKLFVQKGPSLQTQNNCWLVEAPFRTFFTTLGL